MASLKVTDVPDTATIGITIEDGKFVVLFSWDDGASGYDGKAIGIVLEDTVRAAIADVED